MEEIGSKEERRKRKKKIEVADLFRYYKKRPSTDTKEIGGLPLIKDDTTSPTPKEESPPAAVKIESPIPATPVPVEKLPAEEPDEMEVEQKKKKKKKNKEKKKEQRTLIKDHGKFVFIHFILFHKILLNLF